LIQSMKEVYTLAHAKGVGLLDDAIDKTMGFLDKTPAGSTSSMQRDMMEGKPSELDVLNGAVFRIGEDLGVEVPTNRFIYAALAPLENRARSGDLEGLDI